MRKVKWGNITTLVRINMSRIKNIYYDEGREIVMLRLMNTVVQKRRKKMVQFKTLFVVLTIGRAMSDYTSVQALYDV